MCSEIIFGSRGHFFLCGGGGRTRTERSYCVFKLTPLFWKQMVLYRRMKMSYSFFRQGRKIYGSCERDRDLLSSKVNIEPALKEFIGHQGHSKLRRGSEHTSCRKEKTCVYLNWFVMFFISVSFQHMWPITLQTEEHPVSCALKWHNGIWKTSLSNRLIYVFHIFTA